MVAKHHPEAITAGYWFVSPYSNFEDEPKTERREHTPCQTGAHIYDGDGNLVWSGACKYGNRNVFGFKPVDINGTQHLEFYLPGEELGNNIAKGHRVQSGVVINNQYEEVSRTQSQGGRWLDIHEFDVQADGKTVILSTIWPVLRNASEIGQGERHVFTTGFQEIEMSTGKLVFDWDPLKHNVLLNESCDTMGMNPNPNNWDFFHINSVDKDAHGDYLVSGRHTSTVYKISGEDGHVIWRLGGNSSDFEMEKDLPIHWQHDARFRFANETHTIVSVFDNAGEDLNRNPSIPNSRSVGKIMVLDTSSTPMTAKMLRRFDRPDGRRSPKLGSLQTIGHNVETASVFIDWATEGYISEYDAENRLVLEAKFQSDRMSSYRAFKYPFVGNPTESPAFKVLPLGYSKDELASAFYVSWNGATEVAAWAFYGKDTESATFKLLAKVKKHGFETSWVMPGLVKYAYAEAIDADGKAMGKSATATITPPIDGNYKIIAPILQQVKDIETPSQEPSKEASEDVSLKSDVKARPDPESGSLMTNVFDAVPFLVVNGLALLGFYCVVRNIIHEVIRRRKGYKALNVFVPSP